MVYGSLISCILGVIAFSKLESGLLDINDSERIKTAQEQYYHSIAAPVFLGIGIGGSVASFFVFIYCPRRPSKAFYPRDD